MKKHILIGMILFLVLTIGFFIYVNVFTQPSQDALPPTTDKQTIVDVKLDVIAPFSTASVSISNSGNVVYEASSPDTGIERQTDSKKITQANFQELSNLLNEKDFWSFNEKYINENLQDVTTYIVTVRSFPSSQDPALSFPGSYSVTCYWECPNDIVDIINKIKEIWGKEILEVGV